MTRSTRVRLVVSDALARPKARSMDVGDAALLDDASEDLRDNIAYRGGALERVMFTLPFAMSRR